MRRTVGLVLMALAAAGSAAPFEGDAAIAAWRRIQCSTQDLEPVVFHWSGRVWSRVPGEPDRHLWNVEGMNVRQCVTVRDPVRGQGVRMVSREVMIYLDPTTGRIVDEWRNPWTGRTNRVFHVANDPVNGRPVFPRGPDGQPFRLPLRVEDGRAFWNIEVPLFYANPLGGDFQDQVGNQYHAMEIFDFTVDAARLSDPRVRNARPAVAWVRIAPWLPFMEMGSRPGLMVFNATGQVVAGIDALPAELRQAIATRWPQYRSPPPADDERPNATTWTEYRKFLEAERARAGR
ncbi:MAG: DUF1838 domain-containing protein [Sphingomonadaceae bacterium]|uniref:DUF1838 family protein n=1 Tax=Thermaurantiacus sp. TaxID=2820283 RepID=UPI00298F1AC3|nr:DUF1838 family protein [Thermaurantiacus sp.]MCS6985937.1 DUF1838 domain-containing protein [Sphingomonadaceae bacterium]MDW8414847.1 DUF1838 family protein [Thermaurantiacus sp.]